MASRRRLPVFTENFTRNLDSIGLFLEPEGTTAFQQLLGRLFDDIIPSLCQYPRSGRMFLQHPVRSKEAQVLLRRLKTLIKKGDELREFVVDDYLVLYLFRKTQVIFLSIKHHRQLSFDLRRFWLS
ncbi:MAG TPA: type II toxin-antitoxin system RelE/ParE family toxin [Candidatus Avalokitesvara rifleensis]|uniref:type II toxin-antitoxin system RelE/ParE family toxin n=1 Tax=Candidatus Avalokitesvara rifleensis TaxID=3367620 RepID=UPI0040259037